MNVTAVTLAQAEKDAKAQGVKVNAVLLDREYPFEVVALGAALDEAISAEEMHRMYDLPALADKAVQIRSGVDALAKLRDAQVLA